MASSLEYVPVPFHDDNYAWVVTNGDHAIVVDPGEAEPVIRFCKKRRLAVTAILLTHHHADHVGGVEQLLHSCGDATTEVYGPAQENISCVTSGVTGGQHIHIAKPAFDAVVMATPGHTHGHVTYFQPPSVPDDGHLFSGDTLFSSGCGRLYGPDPDRLYRVTSPILKSSRLTAHSEVTKWYGPRRETFVIR